MATIPDESLATFSGLTRAHACGLSVALRKLGILHCASGLPKPQKCQLPKSRHLSPQNWHAVNFCSSVYYSSRDYISMGLEEADTRETLLRAGYSATLSEEEEKGDATVSTSVDLMDRNISYYISMYILEYQADLQAAASLCGLFCLVTNNWKPGHQQISGIFKDCGGGDGLQRQTRGDSVSQMDGQVTLLEGATLTVNCTYSATRYPTLFWYVQYPGEGPQLLLKATKASDKGTNKGFEATYNAKTTSFHLEKASVQESDSAVYHCALSDTVTETAGHRSAISSSPIFICNCSPIGGLDKDAFDGWMEGLTSEGGTNGDSVNQTEGPVTVSEGARMTLNCTYQATYSTVYLFWKGTEAQGKARAVLALLGMSPTGFGSPVVNVPISAALPDKPPVLTEKSS
ncbi:hypothetical protein JEQ12_017944 [Ovis aries]|uniref:Ig-like domain-containing protein n=1 Tax=Ovis aries TaxID=9940 RepID=A0A836A5A0_SHEEP|nr:hypothetical protein JEQ12_017944 [Ovis aries]